MIDEEHSERKNMIQKLMSNLVGNTSGLSSNSSKITTSMQDITKVGIIQNSKIKNNRDDNSKSTTIRTKVNARSVESSLRVPSNGFNENNNNRKAELKIKLEKGKVHSANGGRLEENTESRISMNNIKNMKKSDRQNGDIVFSADFSMDVREGENQNENNNGRERLQHQLQNKTSPRIHLQSDQNRTSPNYKSQSEVCRAYDKECSSQNSVDYEDDFEKDSGPCSQSDSEPEPEALPPSYDTAFSRFDNISETKDGGLSFSHRGTNPKNFLLDEKKNSKNFLHKNFPYGIHESDPRSVFRDGYKERERIGDGNNEMRREKKDNYGEETARKSRLSNDHNVSSTSSKLNCKDRPPRIEMRNSFADRQQSKNIPSNRIAKNVPPLENVGNVGRSTSRNRGSSRESELPMTSSRNEISKSEGWTLESDGRKSSRSVDTDKCSKCSKSESNPCFSQQSCDINHQRELLEQRASERRIRVDNLKKDARDRVNLKLKEEERLLK